MGKRTRSQRQGSSPKNKVSSHRFPANNKLPRKFDEVGEIVDLIHSPAHTAPLAHILICALTCGSYQSKLLLVKTINRATTRSGGRVPYGDRYIRGEPQHK